MVNQNKMLSFKLKRPANVFIITIIIIIIIIIIQDSKGQ